MGPSIRVGSQPVQPQGVQPQVQVQQAQGAQGQPQGIQAVVSQAQVLPPPNAQAQQDTPPATSSTGRLVGRILVGIFTLGISEGIRALVNYAQSRPAPAPKAAPIPPPPPTVKQYNDGIRALMRNNQPLPPSLQGAIDNAFESVRTTWGELAGAGDTFQTSSDILKTAVRDAIGRLENYLEPQQLQDLVLQKGAELAHGKVAEDTLRAAFAGINHQADSSLLGLNETMLRDIPAFGAEVARASNRAELEAAYANHAQDITTFVTFVKTKDEVQAQACDRAVTRLAENFGLTKEAVLAKTTDPITHKAREVVSLKKLETSFAYAYSALHLGTTRDEMESRMNEVAERFVEKMTALYESVEPLNVSDSLKTYFRNEALTEASIPSAPNFLQNTLEAAGRMAGPKTDQLFNLFAHGNTPDKASVLTAFFEVAVEMENALEAQFTRQGLAELGGDGLAITRFYTSKCLMDRLPGLRDVLLQHKDLLDEVSDSASDMAELNNETLMLKCNDVGYMIMALKDISPTNAQLAQAMKSKPTDLPATHLMAFEQTKVEIGIAFPDVDVEAIFMANPSLVTNAVASAEGGLGPYELADVVREKLTPMVRETAIKTRMLALVAEAGKELPSTDIAYFAETLCNRIPDIENASTSAKLDAALAEHNEEVSAILNFYTAVRTTWQEQEARLVPELVQVTGLAEPFVQDNLTTIGLTEGGRFFFKQMDYRTLLNNPATEIADFPTTETITKDYAEIVDTFIASKAVLSRHIDETNISDAFKASLKQDILAITSVDLPFLTKCIQIGEAMPGGSLAAAIGDTTFTEGEVVGLVRTLAEHYVNASTTLYTDAEREEMDPVLMQFVRATAVRTFLDQNPAVIEAGADRLGSLQHLLEREMHQTISRMVQDIHNPELRHAMEIDDIAIIILRMMQGTERA